MSSTGSDKTQRRITYSRSLSDQSNQQYKVHESGYFSSNLIASKDILQGVQNSGTSKESFIDFTKRNTTGIRQHLKEGTSFRTSKGKLFDLSTFSTQKTVNLVESPNVNAAIDGEVMKPLFTSTPILTPANQFSPKNKTFSKLGGAVKTSPEKKFSSLKMGTGAFKEIPGKKKPSLQKIEKYVIQKSKQMPNFKATHQSFLTKMENILEMNERRVARAKLILSGGTSKISTYIKKSGGKALDYHQTNEGSNNIEIDLKPSPNNTKVRSNISRQATRKSLSKPILRKLEQLMKVRSKIPRAIKPPKKIEIAKQVKSVATKKKAACNDLEQGRNFLGNVRLNRRFELLMKMRMN